LLYFFIYLAIAISIRILVFYFTSRLLQLIGDSIKLIPPEQMKAKQTQQRQRLGRSREKEKLLTVQQKLTLANAEIERLQKHSDEQRKQIEDLVEQAIVCLLNLPVLFNLLTHASPLFLSLPDSPRCINRTAH
jgi:hypothetical protein